MTSRNSAVDRLLTYGGWGVLSAVVTVWILPAPQVVRLVVSLVCLGASIALHLAGQKRRRVDDGGAR